MYENLKARYIAGYCTAEQIQRFADLGKITQEQANEIIASK